MSKLNDHVEVDLKWNLGVLPTQNIHIASKEEYE